MSLEFQQQVATFDTCMILYLKCQNYRQGGIVHGTQGKALLSLP